MEEHLNTSHVKVNLILLKRKQKVNMNLNTSHVKVNPWKKVLANVMMLYLNTSHVKVNQSVENQKNQ